ncbi:hypothetical protein AB0D12_23850 [Streptomyces sp. NPDC048479]|uniref:hypothetical protein n=1 Tax=Streptomyces sp. NPDC048479 TaxID=3154725 RepID=UPI00341D5C7B
MPSAEPRDALKRDDSRPSVGGVELVRVTERDVDLPVARNGIPIGVLLRDSRRSGRDGTGR